MAGFASDCILFQGDSGGGIIVQLGSSNKLVGAFVAASHKPQQTEMGLVIVHLHVSVKSTRQWIRRVTGTIQREQSALGSSRVVALASLQCLSLAFHKLCWKKINIL